MKRRAALYVLLIAAAVAAGVLLSQWLPRPALHPEAVGTGAPKARFPKPELPKGYEAPTVESPAARASVLEYVDTAVLVAALALAAWLALRKRSRVGLFVLMLFSQAYFGFYRRGCVCPIGAIQHVTSALFQSGFALPATVLGFFVAPLLAALFFGRVFCSAVCPLGAMQDVVLVRAVRVPRWLELGLGLFAHVYLGLAVLFAATGAGYVICRYDPFVGFFRLTASTEMFTLGLCFVGLSLFVGRPYCRFVCPYGVLLRLASKVSWRHASITPDECIQCRLCEDACPFGAIRKPTEATARRRQGKGLLALLLLAFPLLIALGVWLGGASSHVLAAAHPTVIRAREVRAGAETDVVEAFQKTIQTGKETEALYAQADRIEHGFRLGGAVLGAWLGLVVASRLISLSIRRRREDYEAERGPCVSCGRCFARCPREHLRLRRLRGEPAKDDEEPAA